MNRLTTPCVDIYECKKYCHFGYGACERCEKNTDIYKRLAELEDMFDNRELTDMDIDEGEPYYIVEDGRYYVVDHMNEDAVFFVGRNSGILRDKIGKEYHLYCRNPD